MRWRVGEQKRDKEGEKNHQRKAQATRRTIVVAHDTGNSLPLPISFFTVRHLMLEV
jgi:hypothetical protein